MKLVKFKNGTYGIRRLSWFYLAYEYKDLKGDNGFWWKRDSGWFTHCQSTREVAENFVDKGEVVDE